MQASPLVSVLVGCYNHERFVVETLESIRSQTYKNLELIIWDDCSRDGSVAVISAWIERTGLECTFLKNSVNLGICRSLNRALLIAKGEYIAMVAADDVWLPDKIERHIGILSHAPEEVGVVFGDALQIDASGKLLPGMFIESHTQLKIPECGNIFDLLWRENFIPAMATLIRRSCFDRVGLYDEDLCFEDHDMWLRISRFFDFFYDPTPSACYRILQTSAVRTMGADMENSLHLCHLKCYFRKWLSTEQSQVVLATLESTLNRLYHNNFKLPFKWTVRLILHRPSPKNFLFLLCAHGGVGYSAYRQVLAACVQAKRRIIPNQTISR
jgi:glycosyltransferase involved in cell wall biosynthesis